MRSAAASSTPTSGRCARGCAVPTPTSCSTAIASAWSAMERRCGERTPRWKPCTRNGTDTATLGGANSTRSPLSNTPTAASKRQTGWTALSIISSSGPRAARKVPRCAGVWNRVETSATSRFLRNSSPKAGRTTSLISLPSARTATALRGPGSSIPSRPIGKAASATTIRRSCRRPCRRCRWP